ncbi:hypothetical protein [Nocardia arthritidis]|uniref:Uncharacterized protein n=1 Tax=Nocardia arthritidis TaxID=228602 RepID=A0A6G9YL38_9NOCA|nr:hypothetical protein [Nocardia arthritidis]QIS13922.1 hypothetical protein F5544_30390 [Nocardia arthritidis]
MGSTDQIKKLAVCVALTGGVLAGASPAVGNAAPACKNLDASAYYGIWQGQATAGNLTLLLKLDFTSSGVQVQQSDSEDSVRFKGHGKFQVNANGVLQNFTATGVKIAVSVVTDSFTSKYTVDSVTCDAEGKPADIKVTSTNLRHKPDTFDLKVAPEAEDED